MTDCSKIQKIYHEKINKKKELTTIIEEEGNKMNNDVNYV